MQNSEMHYRGFIDACASYGIEKSAADRLYKEAGLGQWGTGIKRGLGAAWGAARRLFGKVKPSQPHALQMATPTAMPVPPVPSAKPSVSSSMSLPSSETPIAEVARQGRSRLALRRNGLTRAQQMQYDNLISDRASTAGKAVGMDPRRKKMLAALEAQRQNFATRIEAAQRAGRGGYNKTLQTQPKVTPGPQPTPTPQPTPQPAPQPGAQPKVRDVTRNVNVEATPNASTKVEVKSQPAATTGAAENTAKTEAANAELKKNFWQKIPRPLKWWGNFSAKHPLMGFTMATTPMAGLTAYAMGGRGGEEAAYSRVPTLTPWEMAQYNRLHNGMGLPGLGLDPAMFNMAYV